MDDNERRDSGPDEPSGEPPVPRSEPEQPRYEPPASPPPPAYEPPAFQPPPTDQPPPMEPPYTFDSPGPGPAYGAPAYGTPPPGTPAYGTPPPYAPGYGAAGYGVPHPGWDGRTAAASSLRTQAIIALVLNLLTLVSCCNLFGIAGAVCAGSALSKVDFELDRARSLVRWAWGLLAAGLVLMTVAAAALIAVGAWDSASAG